MAKVKTHPLNDLLNTTDFLVCELRKLTASAPDVPRPVSTEEEFTVASVNAQLAKIIADLYENRV